MVMRLVVVLVIGKILFHAVNHKGTWQTPQAINETMLAMSRKIARGVGQDSRTKGQQDSQRAGRKGGRESESRARGWARARAKHGDIVIIMPKIILRLVAHAQAEGESETACVGVRATTMPQDMATR